MLPIGAADEVDTAVFGIDAVVTLSTAVSSRMRCELIVSLSPALINSTHAKLATILHRWLKDEVSLRRCCLRSPSRNQRQHFAGLTGPDTYSADVRLLSVGAAAIEASATLRVHCSRIVDVVLDI
jgi:hypothetical protein